MAKQLQKKHAWDKVRFRMGPNYVEVSEYKPSEAAAFIILVIGPIAGYIWFYLATLQSTDDFARIMIAVVLAIPMLAMLMLYRPPRMLRLYPQERLLQRSRWFFFWQLFPRWQDLGETSLRVDRTRVIDKAEAGGGAAAAGCVLSLFGPLGLLIALLMNSSNKHKTYATAYALINEQSPNKPIAVFLKRDDPHKLLTLYSGHVSDTANVE